MKSFNNAKTLIGRRGEDAACEFLIGLGHTIISRNCREGHLEVDIITIAPDGTHFVEVKSRVAPCASFPEESAGKRKMARIAAAAGRYLRRNPQYGDREVWFDVITVVFDRGRTELEYFPGAYLPFDQGCV